MSPTVSLPMAVLLSLGTAGGGAWMAVEKSQAMLGVRMDEADKRIELIQSQLHGYVPSPEFALAFGDVKRELDEIRSDVKEIRRGVTRR